MSELAHERWLTLSPYLDQALDLDDEARAVWLASLRRDDATLATELEALLEELKALSVEKFLEEKLPFFQVQPPLTGQRIGSYTLISPIGQGGMGSVWLAQRSDGRFEGRVAIKLLNASLMGHEGEERFKREGSILARLTHPHIAHLLDAGVSPTGQPYLVLEHIEGERIDRYCDSRSLGIDERIRMFLDVLSAVTHAHANLVVHRDIKPSNVLVSTDAQVKLLDFGIAKLLHDEERIAETTVLTREGHAALTPEFAAPEQVTGEPITTATDVYALGVLLYWLLGGQHPTGTLRRSPAELVKAIVDTEPPRLSDAIAGSKTEPLEKLTENAAKRGATPDRLRRLLQGDLDTILAKALKKVPEERYVSAAALSDDLRRYLNHEPISARPDTLTYRTTKFVRRHARGVAAFAAAVMLLAGLVSFYTARLAAERDRARLEADKAAKVSELLTGLLTGADPYTTRQTQEPTVRELLDAGAERVQNDLVDQPELLSEMLTTIGRIYQRLDSHEKAQPLLEKALDLARSSGAPENERLARALNDLGVLLREKADYTAARPFLEQALQMRRRLLGDEHTDVAITLVELARLDMDSGLTKEAEPRLREALAIRRKLLGDADRATATSTSDLGLLLRQIGDVQGAETHLREALAISRKALAADHPDVATALNNVGLTLLDKGEYVEAEALYREGLTISRKVLGDRHQDNAVKLSNLAVALHGQGKEDEAAAALDEALGIGRDVLGDGHPLLAVFLTTLGRVRFAQGRAPLAEPLFRQALEIRRRTLVEDDWRLGLTKSLLGESLTALGRYPEAESLLLEARGVLRDVPGVQGREAKATTVRLLQLYEAWGQPEKAALYRTSP